MSAASDIPWVEKHRPRQIKDVSHQEHVKRMLINVLETKNMPHCLFHGPPGTGKTSAALALSRELFGEMHWKRKVLELNASDERGISVIRDRVKSWSRLLVGVDASGHGPSFKIVILDEADMMTADAQSALRRVLEDSARNTSIIDPLQSRCAKYRFMPIAHEAQSEKILAIANSESVKLDSHALNEIINVADGDLRVGVTILQTAASLVAGNSKITAEAVRSAAGVPPLDIAHDLLENLDRETAFDTIVRQSWDVNQLMRQLTEVVMVSSKFSDTAKARIVATLGEGQFRLTQGAGELLQMRQVLAVITQESVQ